MHFWVIRFGSLVALLLLILIPSATLGAFEPRHPVGSTSDYSEADLPYALATLFLGLIFLIALCAYVWIELACTAKRWHDRDKPAAMLFILFVPIIGGLWTLIECGFLEGTTGPNQYGPSPKAEHLAGTFS